MAYVRIVLYSSPLIGSVRFMEPLASCLKRMRETTSYVGLADTSNARAISWLGRQIAGDARQMPIVLVAYSGAGPLIPAAIAHPRGYPERWWRRLLSKFRRRPPGPLAVIFMDATLPHPGRPRIDELREALPADAFIAFERRLAAGGLWPSWTDSDLAPVIPDEVARAEVLSLLTPQPASFFEERLPPDDLPPSLPCGYLRLSPAYDAALATAVANGWPTRSLDLTHFAPYTHPAEVARELSRLLDDVLPTTTRNDQGLRTKD